MKRSSGLVIAFAVLAFSAHGFAQGEKRTATTGAVNFESGAARSFEPPASPIAKPDTTRPKGPTEVTAREAVFDSRIHLGTFTGDVVVTDPEFGLSCEHLSVYLKKPAAKAQEKPEPKPAGEPGSGIEKAVAEGNVVITQDKTDADGKIERYTGRGSRAVFDNSTGIVTLSGWPQISQSVGGVVSKRIVAREAGCVIILNRAGKIEVKGYHTSTLQEPEAPGKNPR